MTDQRIELAQLLVARLERLSADSYWAHQASGLRGSLLRCLERIAAGPGAEAAAAELAHLDGLTRRGFVILENGAREIETPDSR